MSAATNLEGALKLADYYGGDQVFGDERDEMSIALAILAAGLRASEAELKHVTDAYHAELETVAELTEHIAELEGRQRMFDNLNEALADTFPELERQIRHGSGHPSQRRSGL